MSLRRLALPLFSITLIALFFSGCGLGKVEDSINDAVGVVDQGITTIDHDSTKWQATLQEVADKLPKDIQSTIRNEMDQLVARSIARAGVEFRCNADFLAQRAVQGLKRVKAMLLNQRPDPIKPSFCQVSPEVLNLNEPVKSRQTILIAGYDMDQVDKSAHPLGVVLFSDKSGLQVKLEEARIGRTTHYSIALNVAGADFEQLLRTKQISKLRVVWGDNPPGLPEALIVPKEAQSVTKPNVLIGEISYTPPKVSGDRDFNASGDHPMRFTVRAESKIEGSKIMVRVRMMAAESQSDWTRVDGWSKWQTAYTAPVGWKIKSASPLGSSEKSGSIGTHGIRYENLSQGEVVNRFDIYGDTDGQEAGSYTRVIARFTPLTIQLVEVTP
jgi:hypothetical protein